MNSISTGEKEVNFYNPIFFLLRKVFKEEGRVPVQNVVSLLKNRFLITKWLPLLLAISLVFVPDTLLVFKLMGGLLALILFYHSITIDKNISNKDLIK